MKRTTLLAADKGRRPLRLGHPGQRYVVVSEVEKRVET
jgi:hypothetical protein